MLPPHNSPLNKKNMYELAESAEHIISAELYNPELSVKYIADKLFVSISYLYRCSIVKYGISISECIINKKLERAAELIADGKISLLQISNDLNFCSQSYFCTCFKKKYGLTPLQYKRTLY